MLYTHQGRVVQKLLRSCIVYNTLYQCFLSVTLPALRKFVLYFFCLLNLDLNLQQLLMEVNNLNHFVNIG